MISICIPVYNNLPGIKICLDKGMDFKLDIVGYAVDSTYLKEAESFIISNGLINHINFTGTISQPFEYLAKHHCLLMCSKMEAFGRVTVEALKCGLPVIAANTGGSLEIIEDGTNGYLYQSGNTLDLADKIMLLYTNCSRFEKETNARKAMGKFNEINTEIQLEKVFAE